MSSFTHLNEQGRARMVNVSEKTDTEREAVACSSVFMKPSTLQKIKEGTMKKGDVLSVAQVGGIMGAKKTSDLIPMCHNIFITGVDISFQLNEKKGEIYIEARVKSTGKTGVEMEALTAVSITALTIYDMCKSIDKEMIISEITLLEKSGGKSGYYKKRR
ncbi:cyclic pyranopterin phosphate synthase [Garciella nitratireducens DSM 15102]|uniref:Cyclic pyranopterin monophosphate synthase n=2 Tax=Garciella TaxID=218204 RepID=A0A1T4K9Z4_9FIRM|nr:cyclic pyranopterin monophosphate synthase MoaC [Garciella nitratireducens]RBP46726.1 cyclic pyranopterin monophosphate synthase subunit MoaC [Garciella nitratireducens]SJZ39274.1 cyclic pyranopterin phosphate synthase [Garciella nitratireducens DSM 15102]